MKNVKSLFALLTLLAVSFACAPVAESPITEAPAPATEVTTDEAAFPWMDEADNCCGGKPILSKPKI
ncbi:MAG: hypothetical protein NXI08_12165 [bacterium]|nr:hypothetical protein [bacterium]